MNTRRYPRTLADAFPHTADYACSLTRTRRASNRTAWVILAVLLGLLLWHAL